MFSIVISILLLHLGFVALPGPDFAIALNTSLTNGRKAGVLCASGIATGMLLNGLISFLLGSAINKNYPKLYFLFISLGLLYLFYIGFSLILKFYFSDRRAYYKPAPIQLKKSFFTGFITNLTNIKITLFFTSILPLFMSLNKFFQIIVLASIGITTFAWFSFVAYFCDKKIKTIFINKIHQVELIMGIIIIMFAIATFYKFVI
ncbi:LysE family translocator [Legionella gresilensis]|uniref:LysE family translocator n=1 Tax=Legionella gresilensis TaxID=91823 RepID=UPI001041791D|nr:LysE family translocator [Legionella gresilensis]